MPGASDEKKRIGKEIKRFLSQNGVSREQFCYETKLGKSTVDKLITGIFSEKTLDIVLERTKFVRSNSFAAKNLGRYSKDSWKGYIGTYRMLLKSLSGDGSIEVVFVKIEWDDDIPGLVLLSQQTNDVIGSLNIPHERSPLIYIQSIEGYGRNIIISTMLGEPIMRGLLLTVSNVMANAYIPLITPIAIEKIDTTDIVNNYIISDSDKLYFDTNEKLEIVFSRNFAKYL